MWSHYADGHKGFCLEFDGDIEPFSKSFEVTYGSNIPTLKSDLLFKDEDQLVSIKKFLSYKSEEWKHEEEIRLLHQEKGKKYKYSNHSLKAIYFGLKTDQSNVEIICSIIKANNPSVKFYRMKKLKNRFGIEPEEFFYSTPVEVQSKIIIVISNNFQNHKFKFDDIWKIINIKIDKQNLENHLNELVRLNILKLSNNFYNLII